MNCPAEAAFVKDVLLRLASRGVRFSFRLYGRRSGNASSIEQYLAPLEAAGIACDAFDWMSYSSFTDSLCDVAVGLQPTAAQNPYSQGKSFGKVLAYVAAGVAVVAADALDHPLFFRHEDNGMLAADDAGQWAVAIERLLHDPHLRRRLAQRAYADAASKLSAAAAAGSVDVVLRSAVRQGGRRDVSRAVWLRSSCQQTDCCAAT
jgi:glycosyltransferase involved in cell wall biosynthesis